MTHDGLGLQLTLIKSQCGEKWPPTPYVNTCKGFFTADGQNKPVTSIKRRFTYLQMISTIVNLITTVFFFFNSIIPFLE